MKKSFILFLAIVLLVFVSTTKAVFNSSYTLSSPVIDGVLSAGEWGAGNTVTMTRSDGGDQHSSVLYFQHDNSNLYIGVDSGWGNGWDVYWKIFLDGDYSGSATGSINEPHIDISSDYPSPGGWGGYNSYWAHTPADPLGFSVSNPSGAIRASAGTSNVTYEFQIPLLDLGVQSGDFLGFGAKHGNNGTAPYDYSMVSNPFDFSQLMALQLIPEPATLSLLALGILALRKRRI